MWNRSSPGQIRDAETGNDYFNARYYTSSYGRFMTPDPANAGADITNPQSWNAYAYALGNPLAYVDPSGMAGGPSGVVGTIITIQVPTHCYQTEQTGLAGEYPVCELTLVQISVGPLNNPGGQSGNGGQSPPKNGTKQSFSQCMAAHANDFSIVGTLNYLSRSRRRTGTNPILLGHIS